VDALRQESLEVVAGLERALATWVEQGEQRRTDGQLVRAREALSVATRWAPLPSLGCTSPNEDMVPLWCGHPRVARLSCCLILGRGCPGMIKLARTGWSFQDANT
jgi:hypothetical protein